jgi:hypothetical protein
MREEPVGITVVQSTFAITAAFVINDVVKFLTVPAGVYITDIKLDVPQLDTNGSPTITLDVGTSGAAQAYLAASTVGQAGGVAVANVAGTIGATFTTATVIQMKVHAAPATGVTSGTITLQVSYVSEQ